LGNKTSTTGVHNMNQAITETQTITVRPTARGVRVWLEGDRLTRAAFVKGARYDRTITGGRITMVLNPDGKKKVSGKAKPIIDISAKQIGEFATGQELTVHYYTGLIIITAKEV